MKYRLEIIHDSMQNIRENLQQIKQCIFDTEQKYHREPGSVTLLTVTKARSVEEILQAEDQGQRHFAESYLQEALTKIPTIDSPAIIWHFIGPLQSNKTQGIAEHFSWVHSLDRLKIARRLNEQRPNSLPPLNICIQVNISNEASKSGLNPLELTEFADQIKPLSRLRLRGLMSMPAPVDDLELQRQSFRQVKDCFALLKSKGHELDTLSLGTSNDFEAAIAEGATMVRLGTGIFGPRNA